MFCFLGRSRRIWREACRIAVLFRKKERDAKALIADGQRLALQGGTWAEGMAYQERVVAFRQLDDCVRELHMRFYWRQKDRRMKQQAQKKA